MNHNVNPNMVILARESRSMTQGQLAVSLGITQGKLSKIEHGLLSVSKEEVKSLSETLGYPETFFFETGEKYTFGLNYYRKHKGLSKTLLMQIKATINIIRIHVLNKLLSSYELSENKIIYCDLDEDNYENPEDIASAIRQYWNLPAGKVDNVIQTLEDAGIIVVPYDFPTRKFSGVSILTEQGNWAIIINKNMPADRFRFTLMHELGHIIMHRIPNENMETEADRFAAEILMPTEDIGHQLTDLTFEKLGYLKLHWKVAMSAILRKAYTLEKISYNQYRYLNVLMSKAGYKINEPTEYNVPYETPTLLQGIIKAYLQDYEYSLSELTKVVNLDEEEFRSIHQISNFEDIVSKEQSGLTLIQK